jgi:branched-chain amino acid transport system substrate-binding protein
VQAWVTSVNAKGGLNCHKLSYTVADDGGDPARNQSLTQRLVEQDGVIAFVHNNAPIAGQASIEYLKAKNIPVLGSETGSPWFYESPVHFPQAPSGDFALLAAIAGGATLGKPKGFTRLATFACVEVPICSRLTQIAPDGAKQFGLELVYQFSGSLAQPDYTSACLQARDAKANLIVAAFDPNSFSRLARSCEAVSYKPFYATGGPVANNDILKDPRLDGMGVGLAVMPHSVTGNALVDAFQTTMAQFAPGVPVDGAGFTGWVSAQMFARSLRDVPRTGPVTSAQVFDGLWALNGDDLGGITQPLAFTKGQNAPKVFCYFVGLVSGKKLTAPDNGVRRCA